MNHLVGEKIKIAEAGYIGSLIWEKTVVVLRLSVLISLLFLFSDWAKTNLRAYPWGFSVLEPVLIGALMGGLLDGTIFLSVKGTLSVRDHSFHIVENKGLAEEVLFQDIRHFKLRRNRGKLHALEINDRTLKVLLNSVQRQELCQLLEERNVPIKRMGILGKFIDDLS